MDTMGLMAATERCGFFHLSDELEVIGTGQDFDALIGRPARGLNYIELVCPEDREDVSRRLLALIDEPLSEGGLPAVCDYFRHRLALPDGSVIVVALTAGYDPALHRYLCAALKLRDSFGGRESKYKSDVVLESFAVSMAVVTLTDGHIPVRFANNDFYRMIGWNRVEFKELFNETLGDDTIYPDDYALFAERLSALNEEEPEAVFEVRVVSMNGAQTVQEVRARYLDTENEIPVVSLAFMDITERKKLRRELMIENERFSIIQNHTDQVIFDYDTDRDRCVFTGNLNRVEKYLSVYQIDRERGELVVEDFFGGRFALNIMSREDYQRVCDVFADTIIHGGDGELDFETCVIGQNVSAWHKCVFSAVKDDMGDVVRIVGRLKNIDKQKKAEMMMERRMKTDLLTGLLNKETAFRTISAFLEEQSRTYSEGDKFHALMIIDIDRFRKINDMFGHTFGDNVLKEFASDVKSSFRDTDIVGRVGGDEFIVLMKDVTVKFATKKAGRLCRSLVREYGAEPTLSVSCSIGVAFFGRDSLDFEELNRFADRAMYEAKQNSRHAYCVYDKQLGEDRRVIESLHVPTEVEEHSHDVLEVSDLDISMIDAAFSLFVASDDVYGAMDILLRTVGRKYNLSAVSVITKDYEDKTRLKSVARWISNRNLPHRDGRSPLVTGPVDLDSQVGGGGVKCVSDVSTCNLPPVLRERLKADGMQSFVLCRLDGRGGEAIGYMVFTQFERKRKWSRKEVNTFKYLAKIVSGALVRRYADRSLKMWGNDEA